LQEWQEREDQKVREVLAQELEASQKALSSLKMQKREQIEQLFVAGKSETEIQELVFGYVGGHAYREVHEVMALQENSLT